MCRISKVAACRMQLQVAGYGTEDAAAVQYLSSTIGGGKSTVTANRLTANWKTL